MRLSSLFTSQTAVSSALVAIAVFTSSASAQDRTTEQGEAQITGEPFIVILRSSYGNQVSTWCGNGELFWVGGQSHALDARCCTSLPAVVIQLVTSLNAPFSLALNVTNPHSPPNKSEPRTASGASMRRL
jgi:predicted membrane-bound spermidine synthase